MKPVVVITGVAGGIGNATARVFQEAGWHVIGVDRVAREGVFADEILTFDISSVDDSKALVAQIAQNHPTITALVTMRRPIASRWLRPNPRVDAIMASNLRSVYLAVKHAYPLMSRRAARSQCGSVHAIETSATARPYAGHKGRSWLSRARGDELRLTKSA